MLPSFITFDVLAIACGGLAVLVLILLILVIRNTVRLNKINKNATNGNLAETIETYYQKLEASQEEFKHKFEHIASIERHFKSSIQKVGCIRYCALDGGSDQSYSLALLDEHDDGVVLTGIYSRDYSVTYLKPITKLQSSYVLSEEEEKAMSIAQENYMKNISGVKHNG
jgi:hypothetical protein